MNLPPPFVLCLNSVVSQPFVGPEPKQRWMQVAETCTPDGSKAFAALQRLTPLLLIFTPLVSTDPDVSVHPWLVGYGVLKSTANSGVVPWLVWVLQADEGVSATRAQAKVSG